MSTDPAPAPVRSRSDVKRRAAMGDPTAPPPRPVTLYELGDDLRLLMEDIAGQDGEVTPAQAAELDRLEPRVAAKVDAICVVRQERLVAAAALDAEIVRLIARKQALINAAERLKMYLRDCLERSGEAAVKTALFTTRIQANPPRARWTREPDQIPAGFFRVIPAAVEFDREAALKCHREGLPLPDGVEISRGTHLVIQ